MTPDRVAHSRVSLQRGLVRVGGWRCSDYSFVESQAGRRWRRSKRLLGSDVESLIRLMLRRSTSARRRYESQGPMQYRGVEKSIMSTVLGTMMTMPVVFGVGGYALVSRRP